MRALLLCSALTLFAGPLSAKDDASPHVVFETSKGKFVIRLFADKAPISSKNLLDYVDAGFYSDTVFHRVIPGFMIQGGGMTADLTKKENRPAIKNEATNGLKNKRGTLAMARASVVDSATSQFFVNLVDNAFLDHRSVDASGYGYAVFGEVVDGMDVVDAIAKVERICATKPPITGCDRATTKGNSDVPKESVIITKAYRKK